MPERWSTLGTVACIQVETGAWDVLLNEEYKALQASLAADDLAGSASDIDRTDALRDAQRAWIVFRDADCFRTYAQWQEGSIRSIVGANCAMVMTATRALQLRDVRVSDN